MEHTDEGVRCHAAWGWWPQERNSQRGKVSFNLWADAKIFCCYAMFAHAQLSQGVPRTQQDFHPSDVNQLVSAGMDNAVKVWSLTGVGSVTAMPVLDV
jgi:hypothetical protein